MCGSNIGRVENNGRLEGRQFIPFPATVDNYESTACCELHSFTYQFVFTQPSCFSLMAINKETCVKPSASMQTHMHKHTSTRVCTSLYTHSRMQKNCVAMVCVFPGCGIHTFEIITSRHADYKLDLKINSRRECVGSIFPQNLRPCLYVWQFEIANCVTQMLMVAFCLDQPTLET